MRAAGLSGGARGRKRIALFVAAGAAATGLALVAWATNALRRTELDSVDVRFAVRGTQPAPPNVVVVGIDDVTFEELQLQWPFPRRLHARAIDTLRRDGARTIVYDVQFTEPSASLRDDNALIDAVTRAGNVVLGTTEVDARGHTNVFGGDNVVRQAHAAVGNSNYIVDPGNVIRRVPYQVDGLATLPVVAAERTLGARVPACL
jgi:CHASE2 domain-containing sensor protein